MGGSRPPLPLAPRSPLGSPLKPPLAAARARGVTATGGQRGVPVEDDRVDEIADQHGVAWLGAGVREGLLNAEPGQPVRQVADRLVIGEVRLPHPALRLLAADQVVAVRCAGDLETGLADCGGT